MTTQLSRPQYEDLPAAQQRTMTKPDVLGTEILQLIRDAILNDPRSLQVEIGPSEIGHACERRIGYKLAGVRERPGQEPNWKATVGTAIHAWLETVLDTDNLSYAHRTGTGQERWYVETKVNAGQLNGEDIEGSCDAYDRVTGTVIDWKTCGPTQLAKYKKEGAGPQYTAQANLYGRGWARKGLTVRTVMIVFLPRNGELRDAHIWHEPYNEQIAIDALTRASGIAASVQLAGTNALPMLKTADAFCTLCPFFSAAATDLAVGCPGDPGSKSRFTPNKTDSPFGDV